MAGPAYRDLGAAISAVMDEARPRVTTVALAEQLRARGWKVEQSLVSKWRNGHKEPVSIRIYPDIDEACGVPRGTVLTRAGYVAVDHPMDLAIAVDPYLNKDERRVMLGLYDIARRRETGTDAEIIRRRAAAARRLHSEKT